MLHFGLLANGGQKTKPFRLSRSQLAFEGRGQRAEGEQIVAAFRFRRGLLGAPDQRTLMP